MNLSRYWRHTVALSFILGLALGALPAPSVAAPSTPAPAVARQVQGSLTIEGVPPIPSQLVERLNQYSNVRSAVVGGWDPGDQGLLIYTRFGQTSQIHRVAGPGEYRQQLTYFGEPVHEIIVNPNPQKEEMIILKDVGGDENYQIFLWDLQKATSKMLSDGQGRYGSVVWNKEGTKIAYQSTKRNGSDWDIWVMDPQNPQEAKIVYQPGGYWSVVDWSADGQKLLLYKYISITKSEMVVLDLQSGQTLPVGVRDKKGEKDTTLALGESARFRADGRGVFFTTDRGSEFQRLAYEEFSTGKISYLTEELPGDVVALQLSKDGQTLAFVTNEEGYNKLYLMDLRRGSCKYHLVEGLPAGVIYGLKFGPQNRLAVSVGSGNLPCDTYVVALDQGEMVTRWTFSEIGGLDQSSFASPKLIHYPTFDKVDGQPRQIPAFCYLPSTPGPHPVLINIHGGPESQYQPTFSSLIQYLVVEKGIAVIAPNVRGSHGYGKTYVSLDNGYLREDSVKDIGALIEWIKKQPQFNGRIAVMGGSYGGYMTLASMVHYSDQLTCGIDNVGISNFVTFLENTNPNRQDLRRVEYGDERDPKMRAFMEKIAPANNAAKITKPLYVVQGYNDPRVPVTEAEQMVRQIRAAGGQVWYCCAADEGHGFAKKDNRDYYWQSVVMFLEEHLL